MATITYTEMVIQIRVFTAFPIAPKRIGFLDVVLSIYTAKFIKVNIAAVYHVKTVRLKFH